MKVDGDTCKESLEKLVAIERTLKHRSVSGYCSVEDFVLGNGRAWPVRERPVCLRIGPLGECFRTAADYALRWPDLYIYCEGFACGSLPVLHAWLLDDQGGVIETTGLRLLRSCGPSRILRGNRSDHREMANAPRAARSVATPIMEL